jgi:transcriptional regulator GlxA family with amidase domain
MSASRSPVRVDLLVVDGASPSGLGIAVDLLENANLLRATEPPFAVAVRSPGGGTVRLRGGVSVSTLPLAEGPMPAAVIAVGLGSGGPGEIAERLARRDCQIASQWLAEQHDRGGQVLAACTATFLLGEAGLLDGTRCTTTWWLTTTLARRYPTAVIEPDEIVVRDERTWTAGASLAQTELVLAFVETQLGERPAGELAHRMAHRRQGSQAAHRVASSLTAGDSVLEAVENEVAARITEPITLAELAAAAHTSTRTLARRTMARTGMSPMRLVQRLRLDEAIRIIEHEDTGLDEVAHRVGLADAASLYGLAKRTTGSPPSSFRRAQRAARTTT